MTEAEELELHRTQCAVCKQVTGIRPSSTCPEALAIHERHVLAAQVKQQ